MKITGESKIREVLAFGEERMIETLMWLAPVFERLQYPKLRRAMAGRVSVSQAARIAKIPLSEMLYVLNLAVGADEVDLNRELRHLPDEDYEYKDENLPRKPVEIAALNDDDENVVFVDLMQRAEEKRDPMPAIVQGLIKLSRNSDILLLRHPFDPIPLRDIFARRGFASWAEERKFGIWYIYFFRPVVKKEAFAHPSVNEAVYTRSFAAAA